MIWLLEKIYAIFQSLYATVMDAFNLALGPAIALMFGIYSIFKWVGDQFDILKEKLADGHGLYDVIRDATSSWIYSILPASMADAFAFVNYAAPITELFALSAMLLALFTVAVVIRFIKGWIPTMN